MISPHTVPSNRPSLPDADSYPASALPSLPPTGTSGEAGGSRPPGSIRAMWVAHYSPHQQAHIVPRCLHDPSHPGATRAAKVKCCGRCSSPRLGGPHMQPGLSRPCSERGVCCPGRPPQGACRGSAEPELGLKVVVLGNLSRKGFAVCVTY